MLLDIDKRRTTPYRPQCDGQTERFNRTLGAMIRAVATEHVDRWDELLKPLCFAYNTAVHKTTGVQPFVLLYGRLPRLPADLSLPEEPIENELVQHHYAVQVYNDLQAVYTTVRAHRDFAVDKQKFFHDRRVKCNEYQLHDRVYCLLEKPPKKGQSKKLLPRYDGPYEVIGRTTMNDGKRDVVINYKIKPENGRRAKLVHASKLKACYMPKMEVTHARRRSSSLARPDTQPTETSARLEDVVRAHHEPVQEDRRSNSPVQDEQCGDRAVGGHDELSVNMEFQDDEFEAHQLLSDAEHIAHLLNDVSFEDDNLFEGEEEMVVEQHEMVEDGDDEEQMDSSYVPNYYYRQQADQVERCERPKRNKVPIERLGID